MPLSGFNGGCGQSSPIDIPTPSPSPTAPPHTACADDDEAQCNADPSCTAVYVMSGCACAPCAPGSECPVCDCAEPTRTFVGCQDRDPCAGLDEMSCNANPECEFVYARGAGNDGAGAAPCMPDPSGTGCLQPPPPPPPPAGICQHRTQCGPVCDIACPFGHQVDANGCELCGCNPPPDRCSGLPEDQCLNTQGCSPIYGGTVCACPVCAPGETCPACDCANDPSGGFKAPPQNDYQGCRVSDPCAGLPEDQCVATPGCAPIYSGGGAPTDPDPSGDRAAPPPPPSGYAGCVQGPSGPCVGLDEQQCTSTPGCHAEYVASTCSGGGSTGGGSGSGGALCAPDDPNCSGAPCTPSPPAFAGCFPDAPPPVQCTSNADCRAGEICAFPDAAPAPGGGGSGVCPTMDCERPAPVGVCVEGPKSCDDGAPAFCDMVMPVCDSGLILAVQNGCYLCVDPTTCVPPPPPPTNPCSVDADCPNGYCDASGNGGTGTGPSGGDRIAPAGQCVFPRCDDASQVICALAPPTCEPGFTAAIVNGCWSCLDARTCATR